MYAYPVCTSIPVITRSLYICVYMQVVLMRVKCSLTARTENVGRVWAHVRALLPSPVVSVPVVVAALREQ